MCGDVVRLELLPIDKYKFVDGIEFPGVGINTVPLVAAGEPVDVTVDYVSESRFNFLMNNIDGWIEREQITHYRILQAVPRPVPPQMATFGNVRLYFENDRLTANNNIVSKRLLAQIALLAGWEYTMGDAPDYFSQLPSYPPCRLLNGYTYEITEQSFRAGCASCTRGELNQALDWAAERFGWYTP